MINERQSHDWHFLGNLAEKAIDVYDFDALFSLLIELSEQRGNIFIAQTRVNLANQHFEALKVNLLLFDILEDCPDDKVVFLNAVPQPIYDLITFRLEILWLLRFSDVL